MFETDGGIGQPVTWLRKVRTTGVEFLARSLKPTSSSPRPDGSPGTLTAFSWRWRGGRMKVAAFSGEIWNASFTVRPLRGHSRFCSYAGASTWVSHEITSMQLAVQPCRLRHPEYRIHYNDIHSKSMWSDRFRPLASPSYKNRQIPQLRHGPILLVDNKCPPIRSRWMRPTVGQVALRSWALKGKVVPVLS